MKMRRMRKIRVIEDRSQERKSIEIITMMMMMGEVRTLMKLVMR